MKNLFYAFFVIASTFLMTSCQTDTELSDAELTTKIQGYATFDGKDSQNDVLYCRVVSNKYILDYSEIAVASFDEKYSAYVANPTGGNTVFAAGTWAVSGGIVTFTDADGSVYTGTAENEGKTITLVDKKGNTFATLKK